MPETEAEALTILSRVFGYDRFRPGQEAVVNALLEGRHVLAVMPTGSGKSLCYQVPALLRDGLALVVSPLVALMQDQVAALRLAGVAADAIHSGQDADANREAWDRVRRGTTRILYLAPERLMSAHVLESLQSLRLGLVAVDEAHCISQWGPAFRRDYESLGQLRELFPGVPIGAYTATADAVTRADIAEKLFGGDAEIFVHGFDRPNIRLGVELKNNWKQQLLRFLGERRGQSGIVYCLSRKKTEEAAGFLVEQGYDALAYHAGMDKDQRARHQSRFNDEPGVIIAATIAFGMGIDKPDVRFVFHADIPGSIEAYYQEIGRAGRDGQPAEACMLYGLDDIRMRRQFIENEDSDDDRKRRERQRLDALVGYCEAPACRRGILLAYFGETTQPCGNCDTCLEPVELADGTEAGRMALSAVLRTGQRFGATHIIDILRGQSTPKASQFGHDRLPTFGVGKHIDKQEWRSILRQMVAAGLLDIDFEGYGALRMTDEGGTLLRDEREFRYRRDVVRGRKAVKNRRVAAVQPDLNMEEQGLFAALRDLRAELARERGVPAYVVFADRSLAEMARMRPRDLDDLAEVHGVGQRKLDEFGTLFLDAIRRFGTGETVA